MNLETIGILVAITFEKERQVNMKEVLVDELVAVLKDIAGEGYDITASKIKKNNGAEAQAVNVGIMGSKVYFNIYIDGIVDEISRRNITVMEAAKILFGIYKEHKNSASEFDVAYVFNKDYILANVEYQLVNEERNAERLHMFPRKKVLDLVAIYRVVVRSDEKGIESYALNNQVLKMSGISLELLDRAAFENTRKVGFKVITMRELIAEIDEEIAAAMESDPTMYVLTNIRKINGANILLYKEQLSQVAKKMQDDFYILPSSIHELLAVPVSDVDVKQLRKMVKEVNDNEVTPEEILGYEVYRYSRETEQIEIVV